MAFGNLPSRTPAHQAERLIGISARICGRRTKPVSGSSGRFRFTLSIPARLRMLAIEYLESHLEYDPYAQSAPSARSESAGVPLLFAGVAG